MTIRETFDQFRERCESFATQGMTHAVLNLIGTEVEKEIFTKLTEIYKLDNEVKYLSDSLSGYEKITRDQAYHIMRRSLTHFQTQPELELDVVRGEFIEGNRVIVSVNGDQVERVVHYSREAGDLYITYKNKKYFYYEFYK